MLLAGALLTATSLAILSTEKVDKTITNIINGENNNLSLISLEKNDELLLKVKPDNEDVLIFNISFKKNGAILIINEFNYKKFVQKSTKILANDMIVNYLNKLSYQIASVEQSAFDNKHRKDVLLFSNFINRAGEAGLIYKEE